MLSSKIFRLTIRSQGFPRGLPGRLTSRGFTTSLRNPDDGHVPPTDEEVPDTMEAGDYSGPAGDTSTPPFSGSAFYALGKDVAILKMQTNEIRANMKALDYKIDTKFTQLDHKIDTKFTQLDSKVDTKFYQVSKKFDTLMMLIIGGAVLKGGYDVYKDEFKHSGSKEQV